MEKNTCNLNSKLMEVSSTYLQFQNPQKITISSSKHGCVQNNRVLWKKRTTKVKEKIIGLRAATLLQPPNHEPGSPVFLSEDDAFSHKL